MARGFESAVASAAAVALVPKIPQLQGADSIVKIGVGGAVAWFTWKKGGVVNAVAFGAGVGLVIDGLADMMGL